MAKVRMVEPVSNPMPDFQESYEVLYEYSYCDRCGSFDMQSGSLLPGPVHKILVFMVVIAVPAAIVGALAGWMVSVAILLAGLAAFALLVVSGYIQCGKCRNRRFSDRNVRGYAENDRSVIDVPDSAVLKKRIG